MNTSKNLLDTVEIESPSNINTSARAAVIWMHGLGADANDFVPVVNELDLRQAAPIRFIFPNAPTRPVTINGGYVMRAWYDILGTDLVRREDETGLRESQAQIEALIAREIARGIPAEKIVLAGFSQGGAVTLQTGLRYAQRLAGLLVLSSYLPLAEKIAAEKSAANQSTPILMMHGTQDAVITLARAQASADQLRALNYSLEWHDYPMPHSVCPEQIEDISRWLCARLPA